jgi:hypothetical protein
MFLLASLCRLFTQRRTRRLGQMSDGSFALGGRCRSLYIAPCSGTLFGRGHMVNALSCELIWWSPRRLLLNLVFFSEPSPLSFGLPKARSQLLAFGFSLFLLCRLSRTSKILFSGGASRF